MLVLLVKHWAIKAGINDPMNGTFNRFDYTQPVHIQLLIGSARPPLPAMRNTSRCDAKSAESLARTVFSVKACEGPSALSISANTSRLELYFVVMIQSDLTILLL